jgi:predicted esterase
MSKFAQLAGKFFELYGQAAYAEALQLAEAALLSFPERRTEIITWKLCLLSRTGQNDQALAFFRQEIETSNYWWIPEALRHDPDLASLQGNPEFERLVATCTARQQAARESGRPERLIFQPKAGSPAPYPLLLSFHGWGQNAQVDAPNWQTLADQGWLVTVTTSSLQVADGLHTWDDLDRAMGEAQTHYAELCHAFPIDPHRVVLSGFSQGGGLAVWLALTRSIPACGVIGVGPYLDQIDTLGPTLSSPAIPNVRMYVISGEQEKDEGMFAKIGAICNEKDLPFKHEIVPGIGHEFPDQFEQFRARALQFILE